MAIDAKSIRDEYINSGKKLKDFINEKSTNERGAFDHEKHNELKKAFSSDPEILKEVVKRESLSDLYDLDIGTNFKRDIEYDSEYFDGMSFRHTDRTIKEVISKIDENPQEIDKILNERSIHGIGDTGRDSVLEHFPMIILKQMEKDPTVVDKISPDLVEGNSAIAKIIEEQSKINTTSKVADTVKMIKEYANGIKSKTEEMKEAYSALNLKGAPEDTAEISKSLATSSEKISESDLDKAKKASEDFKKIESELNQTMADVEKEQKDLFKNAVSDKAYELMKKEEIRRIDERINALKNTKVGFIENLFGKQKYIEAMYKNLSTKRQSISKQTKSEATAEKPIEALINYTNRKRNDARNS